MWDKQGVLRGECSCGDCQEFMAGPDIRCEYCDCVPTMHKRLDKETETNTDKDYSMQTYKDFPEQQVTFQPSSSFQHKCNKCHKFFKDQFTRLKHEKRVHKVALTGACRVDGEGHIVADRPIKLEPQEKEGECGTVSDMNGDTPTETNVDSDTETTPTNSITCLVCNRMFKSMKSRNRHLRNVHSDSRYVCPLCNKQFKAKSSLHKHIKLKHSDTDSANEEVAVKEDQDHISGDEAGSADREDVSHDPDWDADTDVDNYPDEDECTEMEVKYSAGVMPLPVISSVTGATTEYYNQLSNSDDVTETETMEDRGSTTNTSDRPKRRKTVPKIKIKIKEEIFDGVENDTMTTHTPARKKKRKPSKPIKVIRVKKPVTPPQPKTCEICGKTFPSESKLKKHDRYTHSTNEFPCQYCGKIYKRKYELVDHERSHTGQRPFACETCGKSFFSKHNLRTHELLHKFKGKFQCQFCGRDFDSKGGMIYHERSHTGERPYPCKICNKTFGHKSILICHERIHTGEKPFPCRYCTKSFRDQSTLRKHIRIHTLEKPYKCHMCDKAYNQKWCLRVHVKQHLADGTMAPKPPRKNKASKQSYPVLEDSLNMSELMSSKMSNDSLIDESNHSRNHRSDVMTSPTLTNDENLLNNSHEQFNDEGKVYDMSQPSGSSTPTPSYNNVHSNDGGAVPLEVVHSLMSGATSPTTSETESELFQGQRLYNSYLSGGHHPGGFPPSMSFFPHHVAPSLMYNHMTSRPGEDLVNSRPKDYHPL